MDGRGRVAGMDQLESDPQFHLLRPIDPDAGVHDGDWLRCHDPQI